MDTTEDRPGNPPSKPNRGRWIATGAAAIGIGIGVAIVLSKSGAKSAGGASVGDGVLSPFKVPVTGHMRQQAYGRNHSLRRVIEIDDYFRAPRRAA